MTEAGIRLTIGLVRHAIVQSLEHVLCIAIGMQISRLRGIQKPRAVYSIHRRERAETHRAKSKIRAGIRSSKSAAAELPSPSRFALVQS